jgi:2',3'-cyclic-nucleotide 2'-phosphodiesterase
MIALNKRVTLRDLETRRRSLIVLFIGDVVGRPGRTALRHLLPGLVEEWGADFTIVNGENSASGYGISARTAGELLEAGADCITTGNHVWAQKETLTLVEEEPRILRPANYPPGTPGRGSDVYQARNGLRVGVMNLLGRVFMAALDCPFRRGDEELERLNDASDLIVVDFHAEATSEKRAYAEYVDGRVAAVVGTHTHVQTADEQILPRGTGFITDCGMTGPCDSIIGAEKGIIIQRFLTGLPAKFEVPKQAACVLEGVSLDCDETRGVTRRVTRIRRSYPLRGA